MQCEKLFMQRGFPALGSSSVYIVDLTEPVPLNLVIPYLIKELGLIAFTYCISFTKEFLIIFQKRKRKAIKNPVTTSYS